MPKRQRSDSGWSGCKKTLATWPATGLVELLHELYELSEENRIFLLARLLPGEGTQTALAAAEKKIRSMLSVSAMINGRLRHAEIKRVVERFAKGCASPAIVADLILTDIEAGCSTFAEIGDFPEAADHLYSMIESLNKGLKELTLYELPERADRLTQLSRRFARSFGYGISDELIGIAEHWQAVVNEMIAKAERDSA